MDARVFEAEGHLGVGERSVYGVKGWAQAGEGHPQAEVPKVLGTE